jgi:hypothetical protein
MSSTRPTAFAAILVLATVGTAQVPPGTAGEDAGKVTFEQRENGMVEIIRHANGSVSERVLSRDEVEQRRKAGGVGHVTAGQELVHGQAYPNPRRMAPGQSGTLKVMAFFGGSCVALPGNHIKLKLQPVDGLVFGVPVLQAAQKGTIDGAFRGKPVYDDFMLFDVPLQVSEVVKPPKKIYLEGDLDLELHSSKTGAKLGVFTVKVGGRVPVGKPLPESHLVVGGQTKPAKGPREKSKTRGKTRKTPERTSNPRTGAAGSSPAGGQNGGGTGVMGTAGAEDPIGGDEPAGGSSVEPLPGEAGPSFLILILGGVIAGILVLILVFRRK